MIITKYEEVQCDIEFLTPAFMCGADGKTAEIRSAPVKAGLRYWWRVLYGNKYPDAADLKKREDEIFGSTESRSKVLIDLKKVNSCNSECRGFPDGVRVPFKNRQINILDYLAYGKHDKGKYTRSCICQGRNFRITLMVSPEFKNEVAGALKAFTRYGGLGSRSRNGFGSLACKTDPAWNNDVQLSNNPFAYPVMSSQSKLFITKTGYDKWENALSEVGIQYKNAWCSLEKQHHYDRLLSLFARPIEVKNKDIPQNIGKRRHQKPFFLGVQKRDNRFYGQILTLPIEFYETHERENYKKMISEIHEYFASQLQDETAKILSFLEAK